MDTIQTKQTLKGWFVAGARPTESQFNDWITTMVSVTGDQTIDGKLNFEQPVSSYAWTSNYGNLNNASDNFVPFDSEVFNSDASTFELVNSGSVTAKIFIKDSGYYEFNSQVHLYDMFNNVDVLVKLLVTNAPTGPMSLVGIFNNEKFSETTADRLINGNLTLKIDNTGYYSVSINPSANSPYPSNSNSTPTRLFIKRIGKL